jgi:hypothetical protein
VRSNKFKKQLQAVLACALLIAPAIAQTPGELQFDRQAPVVEGSSSCSSTTKLVVPSAIAARARLKVRLVNLLRDSLYDDAKGIVNIAREKEIKKLADKLKKED